MKIDLKTILVFGLILVIIGQAVFHRTESDASLELEKKRYAKELRQKQDSLKSVIKLRDEQLLRAFRESAEADMLAAEEVEKAEKYRKKYESIVFVRHDSDSARANAIRTTLKKANVQH